MLSPTRGTKLVPHGLKNLKRKLLFLYELSPELHTEDGLHSALEILKGEFEITKVNVTKDSVSNWSDYDFVLAHGAFGSRVENMVKENRPFIKKCGLCIAGNINPPRDLFNWNLLCYETEWYNREILSKYP